MDSPPVFFTDDAWEPFVSRFATEEFNSPLFVFPFFSGGRGGGPPDAAAAGGGDSLGPATAGAGGEFTAPAGEFTVPGCGCAGASAREARDRGKGADVPKDVSAAAIAEMDEDDNMPTCPLPKKVRYVPTPTNKTNIPTSTTRERNLP